MIMSDLQPDQADIVPRWPDWTGGVRVTPQAPPNVDVDEEPDQEPRNCPEEAEDPCEPVAIPRKGGDSKYTRRHNRGADGVTAKKYQGQDICIDGKAFDGLFRDVLWEVKGHAWSYATVYKDPEIVKKILKELVKELRRELAIATRCNRKFKVGVCDPGLLDALKKVAPYLVVEVISC
jgi:hypothetical protein